VNYSLKYLQCFSDLQELEGWDTTVDHPDDPGRMTKFGISQLAYPDEDIAGLTVDRAMFLIHRDYWTPWRLETITEEKIAFQIFESAFHMDPPCAGSGRSVKIAQGALIIHGVKVIFDGIIGPQTISALNAYPYKASLLKWMNLIQGAALMVGAAGEDDLIKLVKERLHQLQTFGRGWGRRIQM
jgi:lysozyme family protein